MMVKRWCASQQRTESYSVSGKGEKGWSEGREKGRWVKFNRASKRSYLICTARKHGFDCVLSRHFALRRFSQELLRLLDYCRGGVSGSLVPLTLLLLSRFRFYVQ